MKNRMRKGQGRDAEKQRGSEYIKPKKPPYK